MPARAADQPADADAAVKVRFVPSGTALMEVNVAGMLFTMVNVAQHPVFSPVCCNCAVAEND